LMGGLVLHDLRVSRAGTNGNSGFCAKWAGSRVYLRAFIISTTLFANCGDASKISTTIINA
jgi:hypothetical protein